MGRNPNGASSIYFGADEWWHGRVTVGVKDDGRPDRRHVRGRSKSTVIKKVRDLERQRDAGHVRKPGRPWKVAEWLRHWLYNIAAPGLSENGFGAYRVAVEVHLIPGVGAHRLDKLEPEHLEKLYTKMIANGSKPGNAHQIHRTMRTALGEAVRRRHVTENAAALARAPRLSDDEIEPYSVEEVRRILEAAGRRRNAARWAVALALGLRQGEVLGLKWSDVDLDKGVLRVRRGRLRPKYRHGCGGSCGRKHAGYCPQREQTRPDTAGTKSRAGRRVVGLPPELGELLSRHRASQQAERAAARQLWNEGDWVFTKPTGDPLNPNTDYHEWKALLRDAGIRDGRLHDARHTAATVLLILGIPDRAVMGLMGWASTSMAARYQHITDPVRQDVAKRLDGLIWSPPEPVEEQDDTRDDDGDDDGPPSVRVPA